MKEGIEKGFLIILIGLFIMYSLSVLVLGDSLTSFFYAGVTSVIVAVAIKLNLSLKKHHEFVVNRLNDLEKGVINNVK